MVQVLEQFRSVPVLAESGLTPCSSRQENPATNDEAREAQWRVPDVFAKSESRGGAETLISRSMAFSVGGPRLNGHGIPLRPIDQISRQQRTKRLRKEAMVSGEYVNTCTADETTAECLKAEVNHACQHNFWLKKKGKPEPTCLFEWDWNWLDKVNTGEL